MNYNVSICNHMATRDIFSVSAKTKTEAERIGGLMYKDKTGFFPEEKQLFAIAEQLNK